MAPTPTVTRSVSPTITGTLPTATITPLPNADFFFPSGANQADCIFALASDLRFSNAQESFARLEGSDPATLRGEFKVIYVAPDMSENDYAALNRLVKQGGVIEQFVSMGGVAVINVAGGLGDQANMAPDGVGFTDGTTHQSEAIQLPQHPYFTGLGFGGEPVSAGDFNGWQPTDLGTLSGLPADATILLQNSAGPSLAEYQHGDGRVIVSTLSYCWIGKPNSDGVAARNLLRYSRSYSGSAATPAPTFTSTFTPTVTPTRTATGTLRPTPSPSPTRTLPPITSGDVAALIDAIFSGTNPPEDDFNGDGVVTAADVPKLLYLLGSQ